MVRPPDLLNDPQLAHRATFTTMRHPLIPHELPAENVAAPYSNLALPPERPAPLSGQHTREICTDLLDLTTEEINEYLASGILHETDIGR
jgi:crotonobetainyl-CoA:carnitine CoA-transferase CaiB-like acyl-CoA transferase